MTAPLLVVIALALVFDLLNGIRDSSNIVATIITSRSLPPRVCLALTAAAEFCGPFIFGLAVARTVAQNIVAPESVNLLILTAALCSAILWNAATWLLGLPSSSSHALMGGLIGSAGLGIGWTAIHLSGIERIFIAMLVSPLIGLAAGFLITRLTAFLCWNATPRINRWFKGAQVFTALCLAVSHGANDGQKTMGLITLAMLSAGVLPAFSVPLWVIAACAGTFALGTALSGERLIRTLGARLYRVRPLDSFTAQVTSAGVIVGASLLGLPISTSQVVSAAIMGAGAAERITRVRWNVAAEIASAWLLTIPCTALLGAGIYWMLLSIL